MKKQRKITFLLALTLAFTMFATPVLPFASAATTGVTAGDSIALASSAIPHEWAYGEALTLPSLASATGYSWAVTDPTGDSVDLGGTNTFTPEYLGTYKARISGTSATSVYYDSFNIKVVLKDMPYIVVDNNGATIPTFIKQGGSFVLPDAKVFVDNKKGERVPVTGAVVDVEIVGPIGALTIPVNKSILIDDAGTYYVRYSYNVEVAGSGNHVLSKDFTIKSQTDFKDTVAPELSVGSIADQYSLKTEVTLPVATATDNFDENVLILVEVVSPSGDPIYKAEITTEKDSSGREYTFVTGYNKTEDGIQHFDNYNPKSLTFYPEEKERYIVYYWAVDDSGNGLSNPTAGADGKLDYSRSNATVVRSKQIEITEYRTPTILFTKQQEADIPNNWAEALESSSNGIENIKFPVPLVWDNNDGNNIGYTHKTADRKLRIGFRIQNPDNTSVLNIENIYEASDTNIFVKNDVFAVDGAEWTFGSIPVANRKTGEYTITYTARDSSNQSTTVNGVFKINLETATGTLSNTYTAKPNLTVSEVQKTVKLDNNGEAVVNRPIFSAIDPKNKDQKVKSVVTYTLIDDNGDDIGEAKNITLNDENLTISNNIAAGTVDSDKVVGIDGAVAIRIDIAAETNYKTADTDVARTNRIIEIVNPFIEADGDYSFSATPTLNTVDEFTENETAKIGSFKFDITGVADSFAGVTMVVRNTLSGGEDGQGDIVNDSNTVVTYVLLTSNSPSATTTIHARDVKVTPRTAGIHSITFLIRTVNNYCALYTYFFDVESSTTGGWQDNVNSASVSIPPTMDLDKSYTLLDFYSIEKPDLPMYKTISGPLFTLNGLEFVPHSNSSAYGITLGVVENLGISGERYYERGLWPVKVGETVAPQITVVEPMKFYADLYDAEAVNAETDPVEKQKLIDSMSFELPKVVATNTNGSIDVEYLVTSKTGKNVPVIEGENRFLAEYHGRYTVTITVTDGTMSDSVVLYVWAGDIVPPTITLTGANPPETLRLNREFSFNALTVRDAITTDSSKLTVTKKVVGPSNNTVMESFVASSTDTAKLTAVGTYTVIYTAEDEAGNVATLQYTITVTDTSSRTPIPLQTLSTVLIIAAVLLLIGVIIYVIRYRRTKEMPNLTHNYNQ